MYRKFLNFSLEGKSLHCGTLTCSTLPLLDQAWVCQSFVSLAIRIWKRSPRHIECIEKVQQMCLSKLSIHVKAIFFSPAFQHVLLVLWVICRSIATSPDVAHNSWIHRYAYPRKREFAQTSQLPSQTGNYICRCSKSSWSWVGFDTLAAQPQVNLWQRPAIQRLQVRSRSYVSRFMVFQRICPTNHRGTPSGLGGLLAEGFHNVQGLEATLKSIAWPTNWNRGLVLWEIMTQVCTFTFCHSSIILITSIFLFLTPILYILV